MISRAEHIAAAFKWACLTELDAPKPGNVHAFAAGHRMTVEEFVRSADAAATPLTAERARVGLRVHRAVMATFAAVGANTNLGIVLLCAPLAAAAEHKAAGTDLRGALGGVLRGLDIDDADLAFRAIARAAPAGLGHSARHDVSHPATVTLLQAMAEAADRDLVARQYATGFADIFDFGLPLLEAASEGGADTKWGALATFLGFLSAYPDSHIVRKLGAETAHAVQREAAKFQGMLQAAKQPAELLAALLAWDGALKEKGINPGTSADLTVATLFAYRLRTILPSVRNSG
ncbi:MAG TPA: triphosphoribosyl-dephospho-CoA synthase [Xanthobacteraceae bacterium]|nr:triphosphoribosyl-dephospho-CoA synthase [Xanthobacteraceae bacterium]